MFRLFSQFGLFLIAGLLTTLLDFAVYNLLTRRPLSWPRVGANLVSSGLAMTFSFTVNGHWVFPAQSGLWEEQALKFLVVTCLSSLGLQSLVVHTLSKVWRVPVLVAQTMVGKLPGTRRWSAEFVDRNTVKAAAGLAGLIWNFCGYKSFVFTQ